MSGDAGQVLAELTTYLHSRLQQRERWVRIGDVLALIGPRGEVATFDEIARDAIDEREEQLAAVQERYDRAAQAVEDDR
jgi:hypothetical protein